MKRAGAHARIRLESRATPAAAERGFRLLRDRAALARFLDKRAGRDPRFDVATVAFALDAGDAPPHALVDRQGNGITCLGPGMAVSAPVVPFAETTAFLDAQDRLLRAKQAVQAVKDEHEHQSPLVRSVQHPHRLTRDEITVLRALTPILGVAHHAAAVEAAIREILAVAHGERRGKAPLEASWKLLMSGAVSLVVAGHERGMFVSAVAAVATGELHTATRALWQLVHHPAQTIACARDVVDVDNAVLRQTLARTVLPALAFRFPAFARDADAVVRELQRRLGVAPTGLPDPRSAEREFTRHLVLLLPLVLRRLCPDDVAAAHLENAPALAEALRARDDVEDILALASPWEARVLQTWALPRARAAPPRTAPRALASLTDVEQAALQLWRAALVGAPLPVNGFFAELIVHAPVEAILPGNEPDPALALGRGVTYLQHELPGLLGASPPKTKRSAPKRRR